MNKRILPSSASLTLALGAIIILYVVVVCLVSAQVGYTGHESFVIQSSFNGEFRLPFGIKRELDPWYKSLLCSESNGYLYYIFMSLWSRLGVAAVWWWRLPSLIFGVGALVATYDLGQRLGSGSKHSSELGLLAAFALAINMSFVAASAHIRFYTLALFMMLSATLGLLRASTDERSRQSVWNGAWTLTAVLMMLSVSSMMLTAIIMIAVVFIYAIHQRSRWGWQRAAILTAVVLFSFAGLWLCDQGGLNRVYYPELNDNYLHVIVLGLSGCGFENTNVPEILRESLINHPSVGHTIKRTVYAFLAVMLWGMIMHVRKFIVHRHWPIIAWCAWIGWLGLGIVLAFSVMVRNILIVPNVQWIFPWWALAWAVGVVHLPRCMRWVVLSVFFLGSTYFCTSIYIDGEGTGRAWRTMEAYRQSEDYALVYDSRETRILCNDPEVLMPPSHTLTAAQGAIYMSKMENLPRGKIVFVDGEQLSRFLSCVANDPHWRGQRLWIIEKSTERPWGIALERAIAVRYALKTGMSERIFIKGCGRERLWLLDFPDER